MVGMRRWGVGAAAGMLLSALACNDPPGFVCGDDDDCVLGGAQGQCQDNGSCAYPDDDCTSGLSYPEGAPPALAGRCVEGDGSSTAGTDGGDSAMTTETPSSSDTGSATEASTDETTAAVDGGSESTTGTTTTTGWATSDSSTGSVGSSGGLMCGPDEVADTPEDALEIGMCSGKESGELEAELDTDWYSLGLCVAGSASLDVSVDDPDTTFVCLVPSCDDDGADPSIECGGPSFELAGDVGCCASEAFDASYGCGDGGDATLHVVAVSSQGAPECSSYAFTVIAEGP